jgi:predicted ATP-grasp superfamily ATP-dependent carboligase
VGEGTACLEFPDCSLPTVDEAHEYRDLDSRYLPPGITWALARATEAERRSGRGRWETPSMRILLTDGSGLTSRQVSTILAAAGHDVEVLTPDPLALTRFTRTVRYVHRVPPYGDDPVLWLEAALSVYGAGRFDVLFPTQEQVAVLAASPDRLAGAGIATAVPDFDALARVQDKVSAHRTLSRLGLPEPRTSVVADARDRSAWSTFPCFVKAPIGTASQGVVRLEGPAGLAEAVHALGDTEVLVQAAADGPLVMIQAVFDDGVLVASHANLRAREGAGGGASHKTSVDLPEVRAHVAALGAGLRWRGALSMDAILTDEGPRYIDVNPRLVEPVNAQRAGVDLVAALLDVALGRPAAVQATGRSGVRTHQGLLALLGAAQQVRPRRAVLAEAVAILGHRGDYRGSVEELTPLRGDWRSAIPSVAAAAATLVHPPLWRSFASNATTNYALSPAGWQMLREGRAR